MPRFSDDDYLNFLVTEALVARAEVDRSVAEDKQKQEAFKSSHKNWDPLKEGGRGG